MSSQLLSLLHDPSTLVGLVLVTVFAVYYVLSRPRPRKSSIPLDNQSIELPGAERISVRSKNGKLMKHCFEDAKTLYEGFQRGKRISGDGPCLGTRPSEDGPYQWVSYFQVEERFVPFGAGLCTLGVPTGQNSFIGLYGPNCVEWVVVEQSCSAYSRVVVPLYDTLGKEAVTHIINQADIKCVVCDSKKIKNLVSVKEECPQLSLIIVFGENVSEEDRKNAEEADIKILTMREVEEEGRNNPVDLQPAKPEDLVTICYTSGTTGLPKGVMLTHENVISCASAVHSHFAEMITIGSKEVYISYLPLAHILERVSHVVFFMIGAQIGFFRGDVKTLVNDVQVLRPTIFVSVPRLLNRVYDKVLAGVSGSKVKKWLFNTAFKSKLSEVKSGIVRNNSVWDKLVFRKVQNSLGGRVKLIVSGSAPLSGRVMEFLRVSFGCMAIEGYGQTESAAGVTLGLPMDTNVGHVGTVLCSIKVKLKDVPEMNYYAANGEGEVCFTGPSVTQGYYKNPEKTAELFDEDGWVRSGDIGKWLPNGTLKIIDRVKHIFKLSQGEYIAPEKVENVCTRSLYIAQMFLFGDSLKSCCVAIVVPDEEVLMRWAKDNGKEDMSFKSLCKNEGIKKMIFDDLVALARRDGLNSLEIPKAIKLTAEPFSVENDLLTPTFKLKRPQARTMFLKDILEMYSKLPA